MADVIRVQRSSGYTVLPNGILRDTGLSLKTKGLFAIILSLPEDWDYSVAGLATVAGCGRDAIRSALAEMEKGGYLSRSRSHGDGGKFTGIVYTIRDQAEPLSENPTMAEEAPLSGFPILAEPMLAEPSSENPTQLNKDIQNKDLINPHSPPEGDKPQRKKRQRRPKSEPSWKPERFEAFWNYYPRGEDRMGAVAEWDKLRPDDALIDRMARALARQKASEEWQRGIGIPYACRWLRKRRWEDVPAQLPAPAPPAVQVVQREEVPTW